MIYRDSESENVNLCVAIGMPDIFRSCFGHCHVGLSGFVKSTNSEIQARSDPSIFYCIPVACHRSLYVPQPIPHKVGYGGNAQDYPGYIAPHPGSQFYFTHPDPQCFWQCDAHGRAFARPCAPDTYWNDFVKNCVEEEHRNHSFDP